MLGDPAAQEWRSCLNHTRDEQVATTVARVTLDSAFLNGTPAPEADADGHGDAVEVHRLDLAEVVCVLVAGQVFELGAAVFARAEVEGEDARAEPVVEGVSAETWVDMTDIEGAGGTRFHARVDPVVVNPVVGYGEVGEDFGVEFGGEGEYVDALSGRARFFGRSSDGGISISKAQILLARRVVGVRG